MTITPISVHPAFPGPPLTLPCVGCGRGVTVDKDSKHYRATGQVVCTSCMKEEDKAE